MTEYDYSPAALERYVATQSRVSNWVSQQKTCTAQYSSPFDSPPDASHRHSPSSAPASRDRSREPRDREPPRRGKTLPTGLSRASVDTAAGRVRPPTLRSQTLPANHHHSTPQPPRAREPPHHMHAFPGPGAPPMPPNLPPAPPGYNTVYRTYRPSHGGHEIYLPPPRRGETYVIVPPDGRQIKLIPDQGHRDSSRPGSRNSSARSPTKGGPPLLKRLLANLAPASTRASRSAPAVRSRSRRLSY